MTGNHSNSRLEVASQGDISRAGDLRSSRCDGHFAPLADCVAGPLLADEETNPDFEIARSLSPMFQRATLVLVAAVLVTGCRFFDTQTGPSADPTPAIVSLSGVVRATGTTAPVKGAAIQILDGANKGLVTTTDVKGVYKFDNIAAGNANVSASANGFPEAVAGVVITPGSTLDFQLEPPPWSAQGNGSDALEVPAWVTRVRIDAEFEGATGTGLTGKCESLAVRFASANLLNATLGTCANGVRHYQGVHLMSGGGMVELFAQSTLVFWRLEWTR
jgi:carboxypeptidase family protein